MSFSPVCRFSAEYQLHLPVHARDTRQEIAEVSIFFAYRTAQRIRTLLDTRFPAVIRIVMSCHQPEVCAFPANRLVGERPPVDSDYWMSAIRSFQRKDVGHVPHGDPENSRRASFTAR